MADGDTVTVYVSTADPRESSTVPANIHAAAVRRSEARSRRNYEEADALHKQIIDAGYRLVCNFPTPNIYCASKFYYFLVFF